jgi:hypothetical protein
MPAKLSGAGFFLKAGRCQFHFTGKWIICWIPFLLYCQQSRRKQYSCLIETGGMMVHAPKRVCRIAVSVRLFMKPSRLLWGVSF